MIATFPGAKPSPLLSLMAFRALDQRAGASLYPGDPLTRRWTRCPLPTTVPRTPPFPTPCCTPPPRPFPL